MLPRPPAQRTAVNEATLSQVVRRAFSQRRKTLRNSLAGLLGAEGFVELGISPGLRAENLTVADFVRISNHLSEKQRLTPI
jgi:16S rRNA (adenine1518-N6/adenine1519-N6)-dimethyltransferase